MCVLEVSGVEWTLVSAYLIIQLIRNQKLQVDTKEPAVSVGSVDV